MTERQQPSDTPPMILPGIRAFSPGPRVLTFRHIGGEDATTIAFLQRYAKKRQEMMAAAQRKSDIPASIFPFVGTSAVSHAGLRTTLSRIFTIITMPAAMHPSFR